MNADDDYIITPTILNEEVVEFVYNVTDDFVIEPISVYVGRSGGVLDDRLTDEELEYFAYFSFLALTLPSIDIPVEHLNGSHSYSKSYLFYQDSNTYVERVAFYSDFGTYAFEFIMLNGTSYAWNKYIASNKLDSSNVPAIISVLGVIVTIIGAISPGIVTDIAGYTLTALGILYDGQEIGANNWNKKHIKFFLDATSTLEPNDYLTVLYRIYYIKYEAGRWIKNEIYCLGDEL